SWWTRSASPRTAPCPTRSAATPRASASRSSSASPRGTWSSWTSRGRCTDGSGAAAVPREVRRDPPVVELAAHEGGNGDGAARGAQGLHGALRVPGGRLELRRRAVGQHGGGVAPQGVGEGGEHRRGQELRR